MKLIGIVLIVIGLVALLVGGITYTTRDTVVDIGPVHATTERQHLIPLSPVFGVAALAAGVVCLIAGTRTRV